MGRQRARQVGDVLKERGIFWWADTEVPPDHFAAPDAVAGTLTIGEAGSIRLELDGMLSANDGAFSVFEQPVPGRKISGVLKSDNRYVSLNDLHRQGGRWSSNGISFDGFTAQTCLTSGKMLPTKVKVRTIVFDLAGFEEWLRLGRLDQRLTRRSLTLKHRRQRDLRYRSEAGSLLLQYDIATKEHGSFGSRVSISRRPRD